MRAEADALNATNASDEQVSLRKALSDSERNVDVICCLEQCSTFFSFSSCVSRVLTSCPIGVERERDRARQSERE